MSEYTEVEEPFLAQLQSLGWDSIDQDPASPAKVMPDWRERREWLRKRGASLEI